MKGKVLVKLKPFEKYFSYNTFAKVLRFANRLTCVFYIQQLVFTLWKTHMCANIMCYVVEKVCVLSWHFIDDSIFQCSVQYEIKIQ